MKLRAPRRRLKGDLECGHEHFKLGWSVRPHPLEVGVRVCPPPPSRRTRIARLLLCDFIRAPMSVGEAGLARPEVSHKLAVGLFCDGAFHDAAFTRVGGCNVVRL